jgi:hypothetical protein
LTFNTVSEAAAEESRAVGVTTKRRLAPL